MTGQLPIPFTVIGGFLGAGKTTLLNRILGQADGLRIVVLVNDFGSVNIDAALIAASDSDTIALTNGCACCAIGDDFGRGILRAIERRPAPDHIVIEASGVADPGVLAEIGALAGELTLGGVFVLADLANLGRHAADRRIGETVRHQLEVADVIVCSKADIATEAEVTAAGRVLDACAAHAPRLDLRAGSALGAVLGMQQMGKRTSKPSQAVAHDRIFAQATLHQSRPISFQELEAAFKSLPVGVIRAKGFLALLDHDRPWLLQKVGRRLDIAEAVGVAPEIEKAIVLIGDSDVFRAADALNLLGFSRSGRRRIEASEA